MKIAVIGPGSMGCLFATSFEQTQNEVFIIDKYEERAKKLTHNGIRIEGISGSFFCKIPAVSWNNNIPFPPELILVCVKAHSTLSVSQNISKILDKHTIVLTLQNGLGNMEILAKYVEPKNIMVGITSQAATTIGHGYIKHTGTGETIFGEINGKITPRVEKLLQTFNDTKIKAKTTSNILGLVWGKLLVNAGINPLTAILKIKNGELLKHTYTKELMHNLVLETVLAAERKNIKFEFQTPIEKIETICHLTAANTSSMLQDILKNKKTEIDFINGAIVEEGEKLGIETPVNKTVFRLIKFMEQQSEKQL